MSKNKSYVVTKPFQTPQVYNTGMSHAPAKVGWRRFKKGQIVKGEMKTADGKPSFILVGRMTVIPLDCVRELVTKKVESSSSFDAEQNTSEQKVKDYLKKTPPKIQYMDAILLGAAVGGLGWWFAEKKGWVDNINPKHKLYAAAAGAALTGYVVYRYNNKRQSKIKQAK